MLHGNGGTLVLLLETAPPFLERFWWTLGPREECKPLGWGGFVFKQLRFLPCFYGKDCAAGLKGTAQI